MNKIVVKNTCIVINDYDFNDCPKLENQFRIYNITTHSHYYIGLYYDEKQRKLYLPRGIDIWYVEKLLEEKAYVEKNQYNEFDRYDDTRMRYLPRDEDQLKAARFMVGSGEYTETATKSQLQLNLNTGKGKTYCSIATMAYMGIKSVVITDAVSVLKQWHRNILEYTNMTPRNIYYVDGSKSINHILSKSIKELEPIKVFLISHATIQNYAANNGWEAVGELFRHMRVGLKFFDEAHKNFANMLMIDFYTTVYKTYYITATPERSNDDENRIYQLSFKNILCIDLFNPDIDPHTDYIALRYHSRPTPPIISACKNNYGLDRNKYTDYIVTNENFKKIAVVVINLALKLAPEPQQKILIYIGTNNAIDIFKPYLEEMFPFLVGNIGVFTSTRTKEEKNVALKSKKVILSTTKSTGTAVDIKGLKVTIVLAEPFKSPVLARQTLGRTRDKDTFYLDVVDKGFFHCNAYFLAKKDLFNTYALSTQLVEINDEELNERYNNIIKAMFGQTQMAGRNVNDISNCNQKTTNMCSVKDIVPANGNAGTLIRPFTIKPFTIGS